MTWLLSAFTDEAGPDTETQVAASTRGNLKFIDPRTVDGHNIVDLPLDLARQVQKRYEAAGIAVNMYGSPIGKLDVEDDIQKDLDRLEHLGKLKDIFACDKVRMFSYYNKKANHPKDKWARLAFGHLRRLRDKAGQLGLILYHENESEIFGDHPDDCLAIADKLRDGESFRMIYDFANYIRTGEDGWQTWQKMKPTTDCFHFKDQKKTGEHVPMGQGDTDAAKILKDAAESGWSGPCTLEPHLRHSKAVLATGAHGTGSRALSDMSAEDVFQVACDAAHELMGGLGVEYR